MNYPCTILNKRMSDKLQEATLQELSEQFGVSLERIRQLEKNALEKMRLTMSSSS